MRILFTGQQTLEPWFLLVIPSEKPLKDGVYNIAGVTSDLCSMWPFLGLTTKYVGVFIIESPCPKAAHQLPPNHKPQHKSTEPATKGIIKINLILTSEQRDDFLKPVIYSVVFIINADN